MKKTYTNYVRNGVHVWVFECVYVHDRYCIWLSNIYVKIQNYVFAPFTHTQFVCVLSSVLVLLSSRIGFVYLPLATVNYFEYMWIVNFITISLKRKKNESTKNKNIYNAHREWAPTNSSWCQQYWSWFYWFYGNGLETGKNDKIENTIFSR